MYLELPGVHFFCRWDFGLVNLPLKLRFSRWNHKIAAGNFDNPLIELV